MQSSTSLATVSTLPAYSAGASPSRGRVEHIFQSRDGGKTGLKLGLHSRASKPQHIPYMLGGEPIQGYVEITLGKATHISEVVVSIKGQTNTNIANGNRELWSFLSLSQTLWKTSQAEDKPSLARRFRLSGGQTQLAGTHRLEISFDLPRYASSDGASADNEETYPLPASFTEQNASKSVTYELTVLVRQGMFQSVSGLATDLVYCPAIRPGPFSILRCASYEIGQSQFPGPHVDPEGWEPVRSVNVCGTIFGDRSVNVLCTFWLAKPLSYVRGSFIACALTLASTDEQVLDLLASPSVPDCRLICHLIDRKVLKGSASKGKQAAHTAYSEVDQGKSSRTVQRAVWWAPPRTDSPQGSRTLHGEIHISGKLKPGFTLPEFQLLYTVTLFPFRAAAFVSATGPKSKAAYSEDHSQALLSHEVEIATLRSGRREPAPLPVTPPSYESEGKWVYKMSNMNSEGTTALMFRCPVQYNMRANLTSVS